MAEQSNGLMGSVKRLFATLTGILATRLELLSNELQEERLFWSRMILMWVVALFCACVAVLLLTAFIVVAFWDESRLAVSRLAECILLCLGRTGCVYDTHKVAR